MVKNDYIWRLFSKKLPKSLSITLNPNQAAYVPLLYPNFMQKDRQSDGQIKR